MRLWHRCCHIRQTESNCLRRFENWTEPGARCIGQVQLHHGDNGSVFSFSPDSLCDLCLCVESRSTHSPQRRRGRRVRAEKFKLRHSSKLPGGIYDGRSFARMSGRRGGLEVGRRLSLNHYHLHHRLFAPGSCEVLRRSLSS